MTTSSYIQDNPKRISGKELLEAVKSTQDENEALRKELTSAQEQLEEISSILARDRKQAKKVSYENTQLALIISELVRKTSDNVELRKKPDYVSAEQRLEDFAAEKRCEGAMLFAEYLNECSTGAKKKTVLRLAQTMCNTLLQGRKHTKTTSGKLEL